MDIKYISAEGNVVLLEDVLVVPANIEKIGDTYFEKKEVIVKSEKKVEKKKVWEIDEELFEEAKSFLKEKKVKGFWLLKGQNMIDKAIENGFIIN